MPNKSNLRRVRLLMTTSVIALGVAVAPISLDSIVGHPIGNTAQADSCFVAGTRVLMADFSEKPIELIEIGELVMSCHGAPNRVVGVERPQLGARKLYALGRSRPFVTAEHPFLAADGWRAINPAATKAENSGLAVGRLSEGDEIAVARFDSGHGIAGSLALALPIELNLAFRPVGRIVAHTADPSTIVYNLLLDGDHAYFADGFLVHNKDGGSGGSGSGGSGSGSGSGGGGEGGGSGSGGSGGGGDGGSGDGGGEGGSEGGSSGSGSGGESGSSGSGESGSSGSSEGGEAGESGSGGEAGSIGSVSQQGPDLNADQEAEAIAKGWQ